MKYPSEGSSSEPAIAEPLIDAALSVTFWSVRRLLENSADVAEDNPLTPLNVMVPTLITLRSSLVIHELMGEASLSEPVNELLT